MVGGVQLPAWGASTQAQRKLQQHGSCLKCFCYRGAHNPSPPPPPPRTHGQADVIDRVKAFFLEDDSFETTFHTWATSHASRIDLTSDENKLE